MKESIFSDLSVMHVGARSCSGRSLIGFDVSHVLVVSVVPFKFRSPGVAILFLGIKDHVMYRPVWGVKKFTEFSHVG